MFFKVAIGLRASVKRISVTFRGLLMHHLMREFPGSSTDEIEQRVERLMRSCTPADGPERKAWDAALADRERFRTRDEGFSPRRRA